MILQPAVRGADDAGLLRVRFEHEYGMHALFSAVRDADDRRIAHAGNFVEHALDVFRKDIQPLRRDDHLFLAALDEDAPLLVALADVSRVKPTIGVQCRLEAYCYGLTDALRLES